MLPERGEDNRVRLQKALAAAGISSRRAAEILILSGRVTVNGLPVTELGSRIDPARDSVRVDGVVVQFDVEKRYFILNKPTGVVSSMADEKGRPDLSEFIESLGVRVVNVGRLDSATSGLLLLTNDGELANRLAHPKFEVSKTYVAKVSGKVTPATIQRLKDGFTLEDGDIRADSARLMPGGTTTSSLVEITLHSGRNRIVRRMLAHVGHPVQELVRRQFGPLHLGSQRQGEIRELSQAEQNALLTTAMDGEKAARKVTGGRPGDGAGAKGMRGFAGGSSRKKSKNKKPEARKKKPKIRRG